MSLVKSPQMTAKKLASAQENGKRSRGPATPQGRERIRSANLRHGFYSQAEAVALSALGEDPAEFEKLRQGLRAPETAVAALQESVGNRLARAIWRMNRADRMQEGYALRQSKEEEHGRPARQHLQMMRLKMASASWELLAKAVAHEDYFTTREHLEMMRDLHHEGLAQEMTEVALALFFHLREPGAPLPGTPAFDTPPDEENVRRVATKVRAIFAPNHPPKHQTEERKACPGVGGSTNQQDAEASDANQEGKPAEAGQARVPGAEPAPVAEDTYTVLTEAEWQTRQRFRQLLENILTQQVEIFEEQRHDLLRQSIDGPSPFERAAEIVPTHPNTEFMQKMEDSNCRQVLRLSNLLIRLRRHEWVRQNMEKLGVSDDVSQNKQLRGVSDHLSKSERTEMKELSDFLGTKKGKNRGVPKNAGISDDVYENKGGEMSISGISDDVVENTVS